jgi:hypothetical protein
MQHTLFTALRNTFLGLVLISSVKGFSQPKISLTADIWEKQEEWDVRGRQGFKFKERLSFGQFSTYKIDRSWTKESTWTIGAMRQTLDVPQGTNVISYDHINKKQTLRFAAVSPSGETADVYAASKVQYNELRFGEGNGWNSFSVDMGNLFRESSNNLYYVQIYLDGSRQPWQLVLDNGKSQTKPRKYVGYLYGPDGVYYQLKPITHIQGKNGKSQRIIAGSVGFEILDADGVGIAAVSTLDNGKVYFSKGLRPQERFLMENLCAAILLQEQI